ncbi:MAG: ABC transporter ATP-binding protein [Anaerolineales bacterium]|jgi:ATP-binding cassette subfamily B protein|nr:ABC transporter ATP-binding protein [Anaerolineales bacterium]MDP7644741.1 ABC transporter ATP-binding protein [Anaerolineales bacterium]
MMTLSEFTVEHQHTTDKRTALRWLLSHSSRHIWPVLGVLLPALGNAALAAMVPLLIGIAFEVLVHSQAPPDYQRLLWVAAMIILSQLGRAFVLLVRNSSAEVIGQRLERDTRDELYGSLIGKSMTFHDMHAVGDVMARATNDVREINLMFNPGLNLVIGSASFLIMPAVFAYVIHPQLMLVPLAFVLLYVAALWQYLAELRPISERVRGTFGALNAHLAQAIDGIEMVKAAAQEPVESERFLKRARAYRDAFVHQGRVEARFLPLLLMGLANAFGFWHAINLFRAGAISVGDVVAFMSLLSLFGFPVFVSLFSYSQVALGMAGARRMLELITGETKLDENVQGHTGTVKGSVAFENVTFGYTPDAEVLQEVTFRVEPGQTVALVGQTGAGKTSVVKLINRIYDVQRGRVLVDGVDVRDWQLAALRRQISIIEQDLFLFSRSVADNIAFGYPGATQQQIEAAARAAQAHDFIMAFNDGYETVIGERGVTLSGGQRQRLALARAFLTDPRILVLDDSTSAIDSATEDQIQRAIRKAAQGRTTFLITHRLSQIRWADLIVVLQNGQVAAVGDHAQLLQSSTAYRRIFSRYRRWEQLDGEAD